MTISIKFDGSAQPLVTIEEYLTRLELEFSLHSITDDYTKICIFADNLTEKAFRWFGQFYRSHDIKTETYTHLIELFKNDFDIGQYQYVNVDKIATIVQTGPVDKYIDEFNQYARGLKPDRMHESVLVDFFVRGLKPAIRLEVHLRNT